MLAKDVMTKSVVTVDPGATVLQAVRLMLQKRISGLPVVDASGNLVGIVTEGDFLRRVETKTERRRPRWLEFILGPGRLADEYVHSHGSKVAEVMTPEPLTIAEDTPLDEVVQTMETRGVKRLPVVRGKRVVGIVSRANLLHALASLAPTAPGPAPAMPRSATSSWPSSTGRSGRRSPRSMSWSATAPSSCGAPLPTSASARR